jgi:hypothetical protein
LLLVSSEILSSFCKKNLIAMSLKNLNDLLFLTSLAGYKGVGACRRKRSASNESESFVIRAELFRAGFRFRFVPGGNEDFHFLDKIRMSGTLMALSDSMNVWNFDGFE